MKPSQRILRVALAAGLAALAGRSFAQTAPATSAAKPYKVLSTTKTAPSPGGIDYVFADSDGRKLYVPKSTQTLVFNLDTLAQVGTITTSGVHGATVDPKTHHGFSSSQPVVMWDTETLKIIKTIPMDGGPDGILFDPATEQVLILSHSAPNVTLIDAKDGTVTGTIDLGGQPEQGASDGKGKVYIDLED
jgi:DNA-binding beta-propeller fold protein YncE